MRSIFYFRLVNFFPLAMVIVIHINWDEPNSSTHQNVFRWEYCTEEHSMCVTSKYPQGIFKYMLLMHSIIMLNVLLSIISISSSTSRFKKTFDIIRCPSDVVFRLFWPFLLVGILNGMLFQSMICSFNFILQTNSILEYSTLLIYFLNGNNHD